ncbi:alpha-E domain-containing protein [Algibacter amylolyticus]|uniref:Alpha-E domain-containing protein n=1 Tax=Algibacter amylolyticus TaxID=1608400 RepID=A0A5M7BDI3_9FLAO|nr:alpha-E domain-containing protein [Algibacter amylolyticus]KAA5826307.1 alpha-E domain-containing protein [Algibacter amylolyticus]MBB5268510.1 putative alpha-E superfamily protein [Algibacter amylolyticus]TSJ80345.1 alpha-E domain-containing protein [Algibacter amylolyticus]
MLSRVANNLIWLDRYMERGNGILSLLKVNYYANQDSPELFSWTPIMKTFTTYDNEFYTEDSLECIKFMVLNTENSNSILNIVTKARENARSVQEHISRELWLCINNYYLYLTKNDLPKKLEEDPVQFLEDLRNYHLVYYGTSDITQERGPSYYFMNIGKYLERVILISDFTSLKLIDISNTTDALEKSFYWKNLLLSIGGYQLYLKTHKSTFNEEHVISMVFQDKLFPRSVYYCINKLNKHINQLIDCKELEKNKIDFLLGKLESTIKYTTIENINNQGLTSFISDIKEDIRNISLNINAVYFSQNN